MKAHRLERLDRRDALRLLGGGALAAASVGGCSKAAPSIETTRPEAASAKGIEGDRSLRVGYLPITDAAPLLAAHARGFFAAEGLDVARPTLLRSWPQVAEAFQARQVDLVHLLMPMTI
jgi:NitT/TauT family transport system substrate-binding protein